MFDYSNYKDISIAHGVAEEAGGIHVYIFLVDGLLIDCGPLSMAEDVKAFCLGHRVAQLAVTHMHEDHCGMAAWVQKSLKAPVFLHSDAIEEAHTDSNHAEFRRYAWGVRPGFDAIAMPEVIKTDRYAFEAIHTPGHLPHHCAFFEREQGWLFTGDMFVHSKPRYCSSGENMSQLISSLKKLLALDFKVVFCAHRGVLENGRELMEEKLSYLLDFRERVHGLRVRGLTDREIDVEIFPSHQNRPDFSGGEWSSYHMVHTI